MQLHAVCIDRSAPKQGDDNHLTSIMFSVDCVTLLTVYFIRKNEIYVLKIEYDFTT